MIFGAAKNIILAVLLFFFCVSAEIVWGQDYKIKHLQSKLTLSGFDPGPIDGFWGKRTASALARLLKSVWPNSRIVQCCFVMAWTSS